jgi:hypothetical protein
MTLKQKHLEAIEKSINQEKVKYTYHDYKIIGQNVAAEKCEAITEEISIGFYNWMRNLSVSDGMKQNGNKIMFLTLEELFQLFKQQSGL